jgi:hypothetical protein
MLPKRLGLQLGFALGLIAVGLSLLAVPVAAEPDPQLCPLPIGCVVRLSGPAQASVGTAPIVSGRGFLAQEPIFFFLNCETPGQVAVYDAILTDSRGSFTIGIGIPSNATGSCQIGAFGLFGGTLGLLPIFIFGSGVVTFPTVAALRTAVPGAPPVTPPTPMPVPTPTPTAGPPASPTPTRKVGGTSNPRAGGIAALAGGIGALALIVAQGRKRDT